MKNIQKLAFIATLLGGSAFADAPNPVFNITYHQGMTLIKVGEEKGREILKTPEGQQVCFAKYNEYMRFGYVDGTNCMITYAGARNINLNSDQAYLVHVPEGGEWISANDMANWDGSFYLSSSGPDKASSPAFIKGSPAGTFYAPFSHNGLWYAQNGQEKNTGDRNQIQVFKANAFPNPIFGIPYNKNYKLVRLGKENGAPILKGPDNSEICAGYFASQKTFRFGKIEGTNCLVPAWGANNFNLNGTIAFKVSAPAGGKWMPLAEAKINGNIPTSNSGTHNNFMPAYIPDVNGKKGGYGIHGISDKRSWFVRVNNGQYSEIDSVNDGMEGSTQVYVPNSDIVQTFGINKLFTLVAEGQQQGKESQLLKDPAGNLVCIYDYDPTVFGGGERQLVVGNVKDGKCRFEAWGNRTGDMKNGYYVIANGDWKKRSEISDADLISKGMLRSKGGISNYSTLIGSVKGFAGKCHGDEHQYKVWYVNAAGKNINDVPATDPEHMIFIAKEGAPENKPFVPYPVKAFGISNKITLIKDGDQAGKEAQLLKDPAGNYVCGYDFDPQIFGAGERQFPFGYVKDNKCMFEAWGKREPLMKDGGYYVQATGAWKKKSEISDNEFVEKAIFVKKGPLTKYSVGIGSMNGLAGKMHGDEYGGKVWYVKADGGVQGDIPPTDPNHKLFVAGDAAPTAAPTDLSDAPNPVQGFGYSKAVTFVKLGGEKGRTILKDPENRTLCVAKVPGQNLMRFGLVDGEDCIITWAGAKKVSLRSNDAYLIHAPNGGDWISANDLVAKGDNAYMMTVTPDKAISPAYVKGVSAGTFYTPNSHNGLWYPIKVGNDYQEKLNNDRNAIQVFVPKDGSAPTPAPAATGPVPNPLFDMGYEGDIITLVRQGQEAGKEILKDPAGNAVCLARFRPADFGNQGQDRLNFGYVDGSNCRIGAWGGKSVSLTSDKAFLVHAPKGGKWVDVANAGNLMDLALSQKAKNNETTQAIGYSKSMSTTMTFSPISKTGWFAKKGTNDEITENNTANIQVYVPNKDAPAAPAAAPTPVDPKTVFKLNDLMTLVKFGEEAGKDIIKDPKGNPVCAFDYNPAIFKAGERQFVFGNARDNKCNFEAWGKREPLMQDGGYYLTFAKSGSWKKRSDANAEEMARSILVEANNNTTYAMGIASYQGFAGKRFGENVWLVDGNGVVLSSKSVGDTEGMVFIPNKDAPTQAPIPVVETPTPAPTPVVTETPKPAEVVAPAPVSTPVSDAPTVVTPTPAVDTPKPEATPVAAKTSDDLVGLIQNGQVVVDDPDLVKKLESQQTVSLDGEPFMWSDYGKGFALTPISVSPSSGVICRIITNDKAYVGNVYKNNRSVIKDATIGDVKLGDFICRAGTDIDGGKVYASTSFQVLGSRGEVPLWGPIANSQISMWETGYKGTVAGTQVTENGKQITVPGICRARKEKSDDTKFHVGRATMDASNKPHCYIKASGTETDLTGDYLQSVEVLFRPTLEGTTTAAPVGATVAPAQTAVPAGAQVVTAAPTVPVASTTVQAPVPAPTA